MLCVLLSDFHFNVTQSVRPSRTTCIENPCLSTLHSLTLLASAACHFNTLIGVRHPASRLLIDWFFPEQEKVSSTKAHCWVICSLLCLQYLEKCLTFGKHLIIHAELMHVLWMNQEMAIRHVYLWLLERVFTEERELFLYIWNRWCILYFLIMSQNPLYVVYTILPFY